jgi:hypothetical protein
VGPQHAESSEVMLKGYGVDEPLIEFFVIFDVNGLSGGGKGGTVNLGNLHAFLFQLFHTVFLDIVHKCAHAQSCRFTRFIEVRFIRDRQSVIELA